jgi:hypothetical protein
MSLASSRTTAWQALALSLLLFVMYNLNFRHGGMTDAISTTALPASILDEGNVDLDELRDVMSTNTRAFDLALNFFGGIQQRDGHLVSSYPLGAAVMAVPFFAVAKYTGYLREWHHYRVTAKIAASTMVALSAMFIYLALRSQLPQAIAWLLALFFGLGTSSWSVSSQELWQHGPGALCLSIALYALIRQQQHATHANALIAGMALGMAVYCRLLNAIPTAALTLYMLVHQRRYLAGFLLPLAIFAGAIAAYNLTTFGNISGGYDAVYQCKIHAWRNLNASNAYTNPLLQGLADILIAPSRGLLIYSPYLIPAFLIMPLLLLRPQNALQRYLLLWVALMLIVLAKNTIWWGGATFGPRYLSETCVALTFLAAAAWRYINASRIGTAMFALCGALSIAIHGIGAFFAPCGWETQPTWTDNNPSRFWDWRDTEIMRCSSYGLKNGIKPAEILLYKSGDSDL